MVLHGFESSRLQNDIITRVDPQFPPHLRPMVVHPGECGCVNSIVEHGDPRRGKTLVDDQRDPNVFPHPYQPVAACEEQSIGHEMTTLNPIWVVPPVFGQQHGGMPEGEPGHRPVEEGTILMGMNQVDPLAPDQCFQAMNRPPINTRWFFQEINRKTILTELLPETSHHFETDKHKAKVVSQATRQPRRQQLGAAQLKAQEKLADRRLGFGHSSSPRSSHCGSRSPSRELQPRWRSRGSA